MAYTHQLGLLTEEPALASPDVVYPIDTAFPTAAADEMARLEAFNKHHYRPNTYLHKWWARRCGSTFRHILKSLVTNPFQSPYYVPGGLEGKVVLDPMMGGGTTLHEAIRLGANVIGADVEPIPILQARATLSDIPLAKLEAAYETLTAALRRELGPLYETTCPHCDLATPLRFTLYGRQRECECGPCLSVDSLSLRRDQTGTTLRLCAHCHAINESAACHCNGRSDRPPLRQRTRATCPDCRQRFRAPATPYYQHFEPLVVVGQCRQHGLFFASPRAADLARLAAADERRQSLPLAQKVAEFAIPDGPKSSVLPGWGAASFLDLFSSRQLIYLATAADVLPQFAANVQLNMALLLSTSLEFNSMLCGYKGGHPRRPGAIRHTFAHHAYSLPHTALENNPIYPRRASGTLYKLFHDRIRRARQWAQRPIERRPVGDRSEAVPIAGESDFGVEVEHIAQLPTLGHGFKLIQGSSARLPLPPNSVDFVVTDPPYFDSVQYSDLAAFFRVWLQQLLPDAAEWAYDQSQTAVDSPTGNGDRASESCAGHYESLLGDIFCEARRVLRPGAGRLILTFHHWNPTGWAALTNALKRAGFTLINHYVVHAESPGSVHINNMNALTHDAILVLAPRDSVTPAHWAPPPFIATDDSAAFCTSCATLLGHLLASRLSSRAIHAAWSQAIHHTARPGRNGDFASHNR